jgi:hypothetical protein
LFATPLDDVEEEDDEEELLVLGKLPDEEDAKPILCGACARSLSELEQPARTT